MGLPPALDPRRRRRRGLPPVSSVLSPGPLEVLAVEVGNGAYLSANLGIESVRQLSGFFWVNKDADLSFAYFGLSSNSAGDPSTQVGFSYLNDPIIAAPSIDDGWDNYIAHGGGINNLLPDNEWVPLFWSIDTEEREIQMFVGDEAVNLNYDSAGSGGFDMNVADAWRFGRFNEGNPGDAGKSIRTAELFIRLAATDWSIESNRRKFVTAAGKPADLGEDGTLPFGAQPLIYLSARPEDDVADFYVNRGTAGNFAATGTVVLAETSPSD